MTNMQQQIEALEKTIEQLNKKVSYLERVVEKLIDTAWVKEEKIAKIENKDGSSSAGAFSVFILVFISLLVLKRRYVNN